MTKPNVKLLSLFFESLKIDLPEFPNSSGKTIISKPRVSYKIYLSRTKREIFAVKVFTTVVGRLKKGKKQIRFKVEVVAFSEFSITNKKMILKKPALPSSELDKSLRLEAVNLVQKGSLKKLQQILISPYLANIPFPASKIAKTT